MKIFLSFIAGVIVTLACLVGIGIYNEATSGDISGLTYLSEQQVGTTFNYKKIRIIQAQSQRTALVLPIDEYNPAMLLVGTEQDAFYDEQIINIPNGYRLIQIGTYEYKNRENITKTVPAVAILKVK